VVDQRLWFSSLGFKLPWREAGPPNHHDDKVDSDLSVASAPWLISASGVGFTGQGRGGTPNLYTYRTCPGEYCTCKTVKARFWPEPQATPPAPAPGAREVSGREAVFRFERGVRPVVDQRLWFSSLGFRAAVERIRAGGVSCSSGQNLALTVVQGYLTHKKHPSPRTLQ